MSRATLTEMVTMSNPFERFNNTTAVIAQMSDYDDYENKYMVKTLGSIQGDLQPYVVRTDGGFGLSQKAYGLQTEYSNKFFCNENADIQVGRYLIINGKSYRIEYIAPRRLRCEVILKEVDLSGRCEQDSKGNT